MTIAETPTLPADAWEITLVADFLRRRGYTAALDALTIEAPEFFPSDDATTTIYDAIVGKVVPQVAQCGNGSGGKSGEDSAWLTAIVLEWRRAIKSAAGSANTPTQTTSIVPAGDNVFPRDSIAKLEDIHTGGVLCCRVVHRDGAAYLLTSSADKTVKVTALASGQSSLLLDVNGATRDPALSPHAGPVLALCPHPLHADVFVTGSMDGSHALVRWSPPKSELLPSQQLPGEVLQRWSDHSKYVVRAEFSTTTGVYLATASYDRKVNIYRARDGYRSVYCDEGAIPHYEKLHTARFDTIVESLCFIDDKTLVIAVRDNNHLYYMDISEQDEGDGAPALVTDTRYNMNANGDDHVSFTAMHLSMSPPIVVDAHHPDGPVTQRFLLVSTDQESGRAILFQPHSAVQVQNFYGPRIDGYSQPRHCWHASGRYVFMTSDEDRAVWVFEVASGQCVRKLGGFKGELGDGDGEYSGEGHGSVVRSLWFDDVTARLYTGGFDKRVIVWK